MSGQILRPVFSENQILSAADVNGIVNHARNAGARHNRYLHSWGIAEGLELKKQDRELEGCKYVEVTLTPGIAVDGNGREIVVTEEYRLSEVFFDNLNVAESSVDPNNPPKYPVFLMGSDLPQPASAVSPSQCSGSEPTRKIEGFTITFGRAGSAADLDDQSVTEPGCDISSPNNGGWKILLGFVQWDCKRFTAIDTESNGIGRRYVGVWAEDVSAQNNRLTLRSADRRQEDKAALIIDNENDGEMRFGLQNSTGTVVPVFTVNSKGDVWAGGKITGGFAGGGVQVESGVITDGATVPLPAGITQQQIDNGEATIQVRLRPHFQQPAWLPGLPPGHYWLMQPVECYAIDRQVVCSVVWIDTSGGTPPAELPGVCDYEVFGFVKAEQSNAP